MTTRLLLYFAHEGLRDTVEGLGAPVLRKREPYQRHGLCWLAYPEDFAQTPESVALSRALKKAGFRFVGPTTVYAGMQAMGVVNDHLVGCWVRDACEASRGDATPR